MCYKSGHKIRNKYVKNSKISEAKFREIVKYLAFDLDARTIALLTKLNKNMVNRYLSLIRQRIVDLFKEESRFRVKSRLTNHISAQNESKGNKGMVPEENSCLRDPTVQKQGVYTDIVPDCTRKTLQDIIKGKVEPDSISDSWREYNGLVDLGYKKHYRIHHGANEFTREENHIHGIESFWSFAKHQIDSRL